MSVHAYDAFGEGLVGKMRNKKRRGQSPKTHLSNVLPDLGKALGSM